MQRPGFFTRKDVADSSKAKKRWKSPPLSSQTLRRVGIGGIAPINPKALHPDMLPSGAKLPLVYVLGEFPGGEEDRLGEPFVGPSGELLRRAIPSWGRNETRFDYCVRTHTPGSRAPTREELEAYRPAVVASIEAACPKMVLGIGPLAMRWATELTQIKPFSGKRFPARFGEHVCWFVPLLHPSYLLRIEGGRDDNVPGKEWRRIWVEHLRRAYGWAETLPSPKVVEVSSAADGIQTVSTMQDLEAAFDSLRKEDLVGIDLETQGLRPYRNDSRILSIALSGERTTYSFGFAHDQVQWTDADKKHIVALLQELLISKDRCVVAHNAPFEMEWLAHSMGEQFLEARWHCSLQAAYALDPGPPGEKHGAGLSLDALCLRYYGLALKSLSVASTWVKRLQEVALDKLLAYNALDAKWCRRLFVDHLEDEVIREKVVESYKRQLDRMAPVVIAQRRGLPIVQQVVRSFKQEFMRNREELTEAINKDKDVIRFSKEHGSLNPDSPQQVGKLLGGMLKLPGVRLGNGRYCTDKTVLGGLVSTHPLVGQLLELRSFQKVMGTYVDRFDIDHPESYVYPDGKIHQQLGISSTRTGRLNSEGPNSQTWPRRKYKEVRRQMTAPKGYFFITSDLGQIEARVLAMESRDPVWVKMLFDDYDVHAEWAEKIARRDEAFAARYKGDFKAMRNEAKNKWVFPAFFGSSVESMIKGLDLAEKVGRSLYEEFWDVFGNIKRWQHRKWFEYKKTGMVRTLTGRRRMAPLSWNMVINTPIQNPAVDISLDTMVRLVKLSIETDRPWLAPVSQVHDELVNLVPERKLEESIEIVVREQLGFKAAWLNVPLSVEISSGPNLIDLESVGAWRSDRI